MSHSCRRVFSKLLDDVIAELKSVLMGRNLFVGLVLVCMTASGQFKAVGPAPYTAVVARQRIKAALGKVDPSNRQATITTLSGLLNWYRDIVDDELIAAWKRDDGRENLPDVVVALADAKVGSAVVEFSWRQRREATFVPPNTPMFGNLMLRFPESAKPFLDDLLGSPAPELGEQAAFTVCRILLDMPDIGEWRKNAAAILPRYREAAETLLAADMAQGSPEKRSRALYWTSVLRPPSPAGGLSSRSSMPEAASGTLECSGNAIAPNAEYVFRNVVTVGRRFDFDRKIWDVSFVRGAGETQDMVLRNKSSKAQRSCTVKWSSVP